ncbi:MAG: YkvA family protein [Pseudomonadota bacterium]
MRISFELSDSDLEHFKSVMTKARESARGKDTDAIIEAAHHVLGQVNQSETSDFIRDRMNTLETLIGMVLDNSWGLMDDDRQRVIDALSYFAEADDLIPDEIPGLGFLDDAIMIEIVSEELKHEIQAYRDFVVYRAAEQARLGESAEDVERSDWLETRRQQLHSRMRRRRRRGGGEGRSRSPFSLF